MREIKFRAWDKIDNWLGKVTSIDFDEETVFIETRTVDDENYFKFDDIEIMQCTGLKDKNGKEIFEGDIVEYGLLTGKILFDSGAFQFEILKSEQSHLIGERDCLIDLSEDGFEIIGSIYENAELLEEAK